MRAVRSRIAATAVSIAATGIALGAAGCGSSSPTGPAGGDPATLVPASAPFYAAATVRPNGTLKANLDAASQRLLHVSDPGARIQAMIAPALRRRGFDYKRDIQPWLGSRAGLYLNAFGGPQPDGAAVIATTDPAKARATLGRAAASYRTGTAPSLRSYRGVSYELSGTTAVGVVGSYAVIGSEAGLRGVVDVKQGANSLAADPTYRSEIANIATSNSLATLYVQPRALLGAVVQASGGKSTPAQAGSLALLKKIAGAIRTNGIVAAVTVTQHTVGLQASSTGAKTSTAGGGGAATLAALPADSWLALGAGDIGSSISRALGTLASLSHAGARGLKLPTLRLAPGFDIQRDLLSWAGNAGLFVRGTGLTDLGAAIVIASKNPPASRAAVPKIAALIQGALGRGATSRRLALPGVDAGVAITPATVPLAIDVVSAGKRFIVGLGDGSVNEALHPSGAFSGSAAFRTAASALGAGVQPVFVLDFGGALRLLQNLGQTNNASLARALPYLRAMRTFAIGVGHSGTQTLARVALGLN